MTDELQRKVAEIFAFAKPRPKAEAKRKPIAQRSPPTTGLQINGNISAGRDVHVVTTQGYSVKTVVEAKPGAEHITDQQAATLTALVRKIVDIESKVKRKPGSYQSVWASLNRHCDVPGYRRIAIGDFERARTFLDQWIGRLNSMPSAPLKDADAWRTRRIAYIKVNTKQEADAEAMYAYIARQFKETSLANLSNDELEKTYRYVASRKRRVG